MKFHKFISRTIIATAFIGLTAGGVLSLSNTNASANNTNPSNANQSVEPGNDMAQDKTGSTKVTNGSLKLNSVPDLEFNNKGSSDNNNLSLRNDGTLRVTDYRTAFQNGATGGWNLTVSSNGFTQNSNVDDDNWSMHLGNQSPDTFSDGTINANTPINSVTLNTQGNKGDSGQIVNNNNGKYGVTQLTYHAGNSSDASLNVPNVQPGKVYSTTLNWSLSTNATSKDN